STLENVGEGISHIKFSHENQYMATLNKQGIANIWDFQGRKIVEIEIPEKNTKIEDLIFSKDDQSLLMVGDKGTVYALNIDDNLLKVWDQLSSHADEDFYYINLSLEGDKIAIASNDGNVYILNWQGVVEQILAGHSDDGVIDVVFSEDGETINTLDTLYGGYAKVWSTSGNQIAEFMDVASLSQDGKQIATSIDGTVHIKAMKNLRELLDQGCNALEDFFIRNPEKKNDLEICLSKTEVKQSI
ncbi:MAG: hypothetical protein F6K11_37365, partial [Leptolyngbya sp. SIO3F4]|nr:hypothetical protein [Leptolyngbya sp. SIO3F4]